MNKDTKWEFYKQENGRILWVHITAKDLTGIAISLNNWWKTSYPDYKLRIISKLNFETLKRRRFKKNYFE